MTMAKILVTSPIVINEMLTRELLVDEKESPFV